MTEPVQVAFVAYVLPALVFGLFELRRYRATAAMKQEHAEAKAKQVADGSRVSDAEMQRQFRDEIWERWRAVNDENEVLRTRVGTLERKIDVVMEIIGRHGLRSELPEWLEEA